jgi:hypothetical protein
MMIEELRNYVLSNPTLVKMKQSATYPDLYVVKYAKKCFYDGIWNEYLEKCRGLVVDKEFNIVVHPFDKIYNYCIEPQCPEFSLDETVTAFRKINGFMVSMTWHSDRLLISTTGSLDSPYVKMVEDMIKDDRHRFEHICKLYDENTFLFECCHPDDPHIIPEELGLYLLGWREKNLESKLRFDPDLLHSYGLELRTNWVDDYFTTVSDLIKLSKNVKHEGFIFYTDDGRAAKIKSPYYLVKKFLARCKNTNKILAKDAKQRYPEEFYGIIDAVRADIDNFTLLSEQDRLSYIRGLFERM